MDLNPYTRREQRQAATAPPPEPGKIDPGLFALMSAINPREANRIATKVKARYEQRD